MPDESCRKCGGELQKYTLCAECKKVTQWICKLCNLATKENHMNCLYLETYQTIGARNPSILKTSHKNIKKITPQINYNFNSISKTFLAFGIMGILIVTMSGISNFIPMFEGLESQIVKYVQPPKHVVTFGAIPAIEIIGRGQEQTSPPISDFTKYNNCIGAANGVFLTIKCPTTYGYSYISVAEIPDGLISIFDGKVFSLTNFSVAVSENSLTIDYAKEHYQTTIMKYWDSSNSLG